MKILNIALGIMFIFIVMIGCKSNSIDLRECNGMKIKGWYNLLQNKPFTSLVYSKQSKLNPLTETADLSFSNSRYSYNAMLTYLLSFPEGPPNRFSPQNSCISSVSLMLRSPIEGEQSNIFNNFVIFLKNKGIENKILNKIKNTYKKLKAFNFIDQSSNHKINAGLINNFRGNFFVIQINSLNPFNLKNVGGNSK